MPKTPTRPAANSAANRKPAAKKSAPMAAPFKLTYATMFSPPESMHTKYDQALAKVKANLGRDYGMLINN